MHIGVLIFLDSKTNLGPQLQLVDKQSNGIKVLKHPEKAKKRLSKLITHHSSLITHLSSLITQREHIKKPPTL